MSFALVLDNFRQMSDVQKRMTAAVVSGLIEPLTHPLDVMKTMIQQQEKPHSGTELMKQRFDCFKIMRSQGIRGFYAGVWQKFIGVPPMRIVFWTSLCTFSEWTSQYQNKFAKNILPGMMAGGVQTIVDSPMDRIKIMLINAMSQKKSTKTNYFVGLYNGFSACMCRNVGFAGTLSLMTTTMDKTGLNTIQSGMIGGLLGSLWTQPFDVIKTIQQSQTNGPKKNMLQIAVELYKTDGFTRMMVGYEFRALMGMANMGIGFFVFQFVKQVLA